MIDSLCTEFPEQASRDPALPMALDGIRIVDFSHFLAGPLATMILADMGAQVIKIEAPERGDDLRQYPPFDVTVGLGAPFAWANRSKSSVALDLKTPAGRELALRLIDQADVVVENFSTGVMQRLGLDYQTCRQRNARLVYCSVSAYGREGEFADRLGFDPVAQAESGFVSMNGYADREGVRAASPVMDISTALMTSNAILGALLARERQGFGQFLEVALFDTALMMTGWAPLQHLFSGRDAGRHGNTSPDTSPSGVFQASDRTFYINCGNSKIFQRLAAEVIDRPDVAADPRFATPKDRIAHREELFSLFGEAFAPQPWSYWQQRMRRAGVPCGLVRTVAEAIRSPEARGRRIVSRVRDASGRWVPNVALPIRYDRTPLAQHRAAPAVGQHTRQILSEVLQLDERELAELNNAGAFGQAAPVEASR